MNDHAENPNLNAVLADYLVSTEESRRETLPEWIARYPQCEDALRELAAFRQITEQLPLPEYTPEEETRLTALAVSAVQNALHQQHRQQAETQPVEAISSIFDEIERRNIDVMAFAEQTGLSEGILWALDHRQIHYHTIPRQAMDNIANALSLLAATIRNHLSGGMQLVSSHLKAEQSPVAAQPCTFAYLVELDEDLSEEQKQYWLSLPPMGNDNE